MKNANNTPFLEPRISFLTGKMCLDVVAAIFFR
jgi:hypothetical protein